MSEIQGPPSKSGVHDDEVDLFELLQKLWAQRLIIILVTLFGIVSAASYAYFTPQRFESTTVLAPPSITALAPFVQDVKVSSNSTVDLLGVALKLSDNVMTLLIRHLLASTTYAAFVSENPKFAGCISVSVQNKINLNKITVSVTCANRDTSLLALDAYIKYVSKITAQEFQSLTTALGVEHSIRAREFYSVESPPSTRATPRKSLILTLGLVLGVMLGVFVALIRSMLDKRVSQAI
ncbi:Wzz/FepE/Etk N-terminal domain-containing protein [Ectopseudomonas chengduensis]|nr:MULTISPECIES: Wzz/FepE/Etk N-terminal domain-containing protein [Pseudomonas]UZT80381.1 Wzz/FepE/Etk N-terminal domain-containing protein [Pseudomonas chengduensis]WFS20783.1 Wzz/FepE/Etk N-terminal domain-containing protein [Pseudomonas sp. 905_Psudmo1]